MTRATIPQKEVKAVLDKAVAASGAWVTTPKIGLYQNATALPPTLTFADLTEASFHGYARQAVTWLASVNQPDGSVRMTAAVNLEFTGDDSISGSQNIYGWFACHGADSVPVVFAVAPFDTPVTIAASGDSVVVTAEIEMPPITA
jgi:hypothetical protein